MDLLLTFLLVGTGLLILLGSVFCLFYNPQYTILGCILLINIDFCFKNYMAQSLYQPLFKLLILLSAVILLLYSRKGINKSVILICSALFVVSIFLQRKYQLPDFYLSDIMTAFFTVLTGFLLMYVPWDETIKETGLKAMAYAPLFSVIFGILTKMVIFNGSGQLESLSTAPALVAYSAIGSLCAYILADVYQIKKYLYLCYINIVICGLCNMRGGLLFQLIIILGIIYPYFRKIRKSTIQKFIITLPVIIPVLIYIGRKVLEKFYNLGSAVSSSMERINTSGRLWAWQEILDATKDHRLLGWGLGWTKKIEGIWIYYGFQAVHNEYLRWLVEAGYIGLFLIILCFILVFVFVRKNNIGIPQRLVNALFIGFAVFSFTDNTIYGTEIWMTFSLLISLIGNNTDNQSHPVKTIQRRVRIKKYI